MNLKPFLKKIILGYRALSTPLKFLLWGVIIIFPLTIVPAVLNRKSSINQPAKLYFTVDSPSISVGQAFSVELRVQTGPRSINAVGSLIKFNPLYLEVTNITTDSSFCSFYLDNTFDTIKGEVNVTCGAPNPGFSGDSLVVHINMRAKLAGTTSLTLDRDQTNVLANDGKGTNILQDFPSLEIPVVQLF